MPNLPHVKKKPQDEYDIERHMQIRDDIQEAIKKVDPSVTQLNEVTKRFVAHFDSFQNLSQETREQMKSSLKEASKHIARNITEELSQTIDIIIKDKITALEHSIQNARKVLDETMGFKYRKLIFWSCFAGLLGGYISFGLGYFYSKRNTYSLPSDFIKMYSLGHRYKEAIEKMPAKEKQKIEKRLFNW